MFFLGHLRVTSPSTIINLSYPIHPPFRCACRKGQTHLLHITVQHLIDQLLETPSLETPTVNPGTPNMWRLWRAMKLRNSSFLKACHYSWCMFFKLFVSRVSRQQIGEFQPFVGDGVSDDNFPRKSQENGNVNHSFLDFLNQKPRPPCLKLTKHLKIGGWEQHGLWFAPWFSRLNWSWQNTRIAPLRCAAKGLVDLRSV